MTARPTWTAITIDCSDAEVLARFYAQVFGWEITDRDGRGWVQLRDPGGDVSINIQAEDAYRAPVWPEQPGRQQKMLHLEVVVDDLDAAVKLVVDAGGAEAGPQPSDRDQTRLRVMVDPAGHPFCLFVDGE
jgi:predicted enzyme related to lactoylglutathione lyase